MTGRFFEGAQEDREYFAKFWNRENGFEVVGFLEEKFDSGEEVTRVVLKGRYTPHGCGRLVGDHIVIARYSQYDRFYPATGEYIFDSFIDR